MPTKIYRFPIERSRHTPRASLIQRINQHLFDLQPGFDAFPASFYQDFDQGVDVIAIERETDHHWRFQVESIELVKPGYVLFPTRTSDRLPRPSRVFNSKADMLLLHVQGCDRVYWFQSKLIASLLPQWSVQFGNAQANGAFGVVVSVGLLARSAWRSDFLDPVVSRSK